ncbi:MAG: CDP-alcohol phosphatidyltransferase family protein [Candidatus Hodarchaeota archaeon]
MLGKLRERYEKLMLPVGRRLSRIGLTPNIVTVISLVVSVFCCILLALGALIWGLILILLTGFIDMLDGAIARATGATTRFGAVLDHLLDRYTEFLIILGLVFGGFVWWVWGFFAFFSMVMASFVRAKAESVGRLEKCTVGIAERQEKLILIIVGIIFVYLWPTILFLGQNILEVCIILVGVLSQITVLQRLHYTWRKTEGIKQKEGEADDL